MGQPGANVPCEQTGTDRTGRSTAALRLDSASVRFLAATPRFVHSRLTLAEETFATPDGKVERPVIHHPGAVAVIAQPAPDTIVLVQQYRYAIRRETWEIPAGTREAGEDPMATAGRELIEEAGFAASTLAEILRFLPAPGMSDEETILYRATGLRPVPTAREVGELIIPHVVSLSDCARLRREGKICDAKTLIALGVLGLSHA